MYFSSGFVGSYILKLLPLEQQRQILLFLPDSLKKTMKQRLNFYIGKLHFHKVYINEQGVGGLGSVFIEYRVRREEALVWVLCYFERQNECVCPWWLATAYMAYYTQ